jgi:hypothetical protein
MENNETQEVQPEVIEQETQDTTSAEDTTDWKAEALKHKAIADRLKNKLQGQAKEPANKTNNELSRDEIRLIAEKVTDDKITLLKQIQAGAKSVGEEISLIDAMKNPMYVALVEKEEAKARAEKAQLGASSGAGNYSNTRFANGQSEEDHKAEWAKAMENL